MKSNTALLRSTIRAILAEALVKRDGRKVTFQFPVFGSNDEEYTVTATYDETRPFDIEIWEAVGPDGSDADVEMLSATHDLESLAFDWIHNNLHDDEDPPRPSF